MKKLLAILTIAAGRVSAGEDTLTLGRAIEIGKVHALSTKKAETEYILARNDLAYTLAGLKPQVGLRTTLPGFYRTTTAVTQPDGTIGFMPVAQDNSSLNLNVSQRLGASNTLLFAETNLRSYRDFSGHRIRNYNTAPFRFGIEQPLNQLNSFKWDRKIRRAGEELARRNLELNGQEIAGEVTLRFFDLLSAQVNHEIAVTNASNSEKIYEIAVERSKLGKISRSDLLQLELALNSARQSIINAGREVVRANAAMKEAMGWEIQNDRVFVLKAPRVPGKFRLDPVEITDRAWERRPEKIKSEKWMLEAGRALEQARRDHGWQGSISATFGWVGTGARLPDSYRAPGVESFVQVTLRVPVVDGGQRKIAISSAQQQQQYAREENEFNEQAFRLNVRQLAQQFNEIGEEAGYGEKSLALALERYEIANQRYILNDISITDLGIAFSERDNTWRNYIGLIRGYWITYFALRQLTLENFETSIP